MPARKVVIGLLVVALVLSAIPTATLATHEADKPVETQYRFRVDSGDEVFQESHEDGHYPGGSSGSLILYMVALNKTLRLDHLVLYSPINTSMCNVEEGEINGGIDRDNDAQYTITDESLVGAYEGTGNRTSDNSDIGPSDDPGPVAPEGWTYRAKSWINWWDPDDTFGGEPVVANPDDEGVLSLQDCAKGPTQPGWYRGWLKFNGTNPDDGQNYTYTAFSNWNYVCECDSYDEAIETIGPPPAGYTVEEGRTSGGGSSGQETPTVTATATPTATTTATTTTVDETATATASPTRTSTRTTTAAAEPTATPTDDAGTDATDGGGPGFGILAAVLALLGVALLARRSV